jgi:hypothetical protein
VTVSPSEQIDQDCEDQVDEEAGDAFEVWDCNWQSLECFLALETQWNTSAGNGVMVKTGLNYPAVDVVMRRMNAKRRVFADLRHMERAALIIFNEVSSCA